LITCAFTNDLIINIGKISDSFIDRIITQISRIFGNEDNEWLNH
jgi:hypothetical protein